MTRLRPALLALLLLLPGPPAAATPPDSYTAELKPLCASTSKLVLLLDFSTNLGTHYGDQTSLEWAVLDVTGGSWTLNPIAEVTTSTVNSEPPAYEPELQGIVAGEGPALATILKAAGVTRCPPRPVLPQDTDLGEFEYETRKGMLVVRMNKVAREVGPVPQTPNTVVLAVDDQGHYRHRPDIVDCLDARHGQCRTPPMEYRVGASSVLLFHTDVARHPDEPAADALYVVPAARLDRARSTVMNIIGFRRHEKRQYEESRRWFAAAARQDPSSRTARYNLACACSQLGDVEAAINALRSIEDRKGLRAKIAKDTDFDAVREDGRFKTFVDRLPAE